MNDVDRALDACEAEIRNAVAALNAAAEQIRLAAAGLPEQPLTGKQTGRRHVMLSAMAVAGRALKDALDGRIELVEVEREADRLAASDGQR